MPDINKRSNHDWKMGNLQTRLSRNIILTRKLRIRRFGWTPTNYVMFRCKPACAPLFSCAHSIVKLRAMVIHVRVYARRLTIHINFTQAQPCRNYRYMPRSWPYYIDIDRDGHEISRFGGLPRELYFPKGLYFPEVRSTEGNIVPRENITILAPPTRDISSVPVDICYIRWSKWMISSKFYVLYDYHEVW